MKKLIGILVVASMFSSVLVAYAEEAQSRTLNGYEGTKIFQDDVQTDYLLDG